MATKKKIARKTTSTKLTQDHAAKLREVSERQRHLVMSLLERLDDQREPIQDDMILADIAGLAKTAQVIDAVATFIDSEARS
jgi:hypothetical protein